MNQMMTMISGQAMKKKKMMKIWITKKRKKNLRKQMMTMVST
jgi:hypothetical protein